MKNNKKLYESSRNILTTVFGAGILSLSLLSGSTGLSLKQTSNLASMAAVEFDLHKFQRSFSPDVDHTVTGTIRNKKNNVFGSVAIPFNNIGTKGKWQDAYKKAANFGITACADDMCNERYASVSGKIDLEQDGFLGTLNRVNYQVNTTIKYVEDQVNYGQLDFWANANETLALGSGDCEDIAILKFAVLAQAGVPKEAMSLVILKDNARDLYHATLAVATNRGYFILDNVVNYVYEDKEAPNYQPLYSFSMDRSWLHGIPQTKHESDNIAMVTTDVTPGSEKSDLFERYDAELENLFEVPPVTSSFN